jgi:hypothetical protein
VHACGLRHFRKTLFATATGHGSMVSIQGPAADRSKLGVCDRVQRHDASHVSHRVVFQVAHALASGKQVFFLKKVNYCAVRS